MVLLFLNAYLQLQVIKDQLVRNNNASVINDLTNHPLTVFIPACWLKVRISSGWASLTFPTRVPVDQRAGHGGGAQTVEPPGSVMAPSQTAGRSQGQPHLHCAAAPTQQPLEQWPWADEAPDTGVTLTVPTHDPGLLWPPCRPPHHSTQRKISVNPASPGQPIKISVTGKSEGKYKIHFIFCHYDVFHFSEDYLRNKLLRSASEDGLNIPSTPEFSFDGNLTNSPGYPVLNRRSSRIVSPTSPASESSSYQGSMPGSGRSEQDSYTTHSERSFAAQKQDQQRKYFHSTAISDPVRGANRDDLEEALLRTGYFLPEYKHWTKM